MPTSCVYFIRGEATGWIKIGKSDHPDRRMRILSSQGGQPMKLLATIDCGSSEQAFRLEERFHERFQASRMIGEWFEVTSDLKNVIRTVKNGDYRQRWFSEEERAVLETIMKPIVPKSYPFGKHPGQEERWQRWELESLT